MKKMRACLAVLLCLLMTLACFTPAAAARAEARSLSVAAKAPRKQSTEPPSGLDASLDWEGFFANFETLLFTGADVINVTAYQIPYTTLNWDYIQARVQLTPQWLHMWKEWTIGVTKPIDEGGYISTLRINPSITYDYTVSVAKREACEDAMFRLMYGIQGNDALSDYDKLLLLHDRLAAWVEYDYANYNTGTIPDDSFNAYGALVNRVAVCEGYSMAYNWMLEKLGIENFYTTSDLLNHGWSKVKLDGVWYYVDVTYDDPVWNVPGRVQHKDFLLSSAAFVNNHELGHTGTYPTDYDQTLTDTTYEASFDKGSDTEIAKIGEYYYYLKTPLVSPATKATLVRRAADGTEETLATVDKYVYPNNYLYLPKMTAIGSNILYTDGRKVYAYNVETNVNTLVFNDDDNAIFNNDPNFMLTGLKQIDGTVYITAFNSPNVEETTVATYTTSFVFCAHEGYDPQESWVLIDGAPSTSCTVAGSATYICKDCRAVFTKSTEAGEHSFELTSTIPATCVEPAINVYTCSACGATKQESVGEALSTGHPAEQVIETPAVAATCKDFGYTAGTYCTVCNTYISGHEQQPKDPDNHISSYISVPAVAATCTAPGSTQERKCSGCNAVVLASVPEAPLGHDYQDTTVDPTCAAQGYTLHTCSRCKDSYKTDYTDALNHPEESRVNVEAVTPNCITEGYTAGVQCSLCGAFVSGHELLEIDPDNHVTDEQVFVGASEPACEKAGYTGDYVCPDCGYVYVKGEVIPALDHQWNEGEVIKAPTCTDDGIRKFTCSVCKGTYAITVKHYGHLDLDGDEICDRCQKNLNEKACPYCNTVHEGFGGAITGAIHKLLYLLRGEKATAKEPKTLFGRILLKIIDR